MSQSLDLSRVSTPALVLDASTVRRNIDRRAQSRFLAELQLETGAVRITCAKVSEAEQLSDPNQDVLLAYPPVGAFCAERLAALARDRPVRAAVGSQLGLSASIISGGSTPTAYQSHFVSHLTEIRPELTSSTI